MHNTEVKYDSVYWDWKGKVPVSEIISLARKWKNFTEIEEDDSHYVLFSNEQLTEEQARGIMFWDVSEFCS